MAVFPGTVTDFKHGVSGYNVHKCRCEICVSAKSKATRDMRARLKGKEPPKHGTSVSYSVYGCRCDVCVEARKNARKEYQEGLQGQEPPEHGLTGYTIYGCRCDACVSARRKSDKKRLADPKNYEKEKERCWRKYGIIDFTYVDYLRLFEEQNWKCAICDEPIRLKSNRKSEVANVDHDHDTGEVRALLCHNCNKMVGCGRNPENLRRGAKYLEKHKGGSL